MAGMEGQTVNTPADLGLLSVSNEVNHVYGSTAAVLTRPDGKKTLVLIVESGAFRFRVGDYAGLASTAPSASVTNGTGSIKLSQVGVPFAVTAPLKVSVVGASATDILTYYWV